MTEIPLSPQLDLFMNCPITTGYEGEHIGSGTKILSGLEAGPFISIAACGLMTAD